MADLAGIALDPLARRGFHSCRIPQSSRVPKSGDRPRVLCFSAKTRHPASGVEHLRLSPKPAIRGVPA